jgi:CHAD domain-containing protein
MTLRGFAQRRTQAALLRLSKELRRATKNPEDADAIHDLRVSIRRYTQCLRTFSELYDPVEVKRIRRRLRKLMKLCGEARNCDIAIALLEQAGLPADNRSLTRLRKMRSKGEAELVQHLEKKRWDGFARENRLRPCRWQSGRGTWSFGSDVVSNAQRFLQRMCADFFSAGAVAAAAHDDYEKLHQFRLLGKRFRYTLELFRDAYGSGMDQRLAELRQLQDKLGEINDCLTTLTLISHDSEAATRVQAILVERERAFEKHWQSHFLSGTAEKWLRWLRKPATADSSL